jgi:diphosphomevalonate decarboxylase
MSISLLPQKRGHESALTSDFQQARIAGAKERLDTCLKSLLERDFSTFAEVVEHDSNLMHAVMMTSKPPLFYWLPASLKIMERVRQLRYDGLQVCYTLDAGPNVHCLCMKSNSLQVRDALSQVENVIDIRIAAPGQGVEVL